MLLLRFLHDNPEFGKLCVMAGVPWGWRTLDRDAVNDPKLHEVLAKADVISPWSVGRYHDVTSAARMIGGVQAADEAWCRERNKSYLPVTFPGFSWANLMKMRGKEAKLNQVPRLGGEFLWQQARERIRGGATMLYVAMFDEMDEGTAIFKTASQVPEGTLGICNGRVVAVRSLSVAHRADRPGAAAGDSAHGEAADEVRSICSGSMASWMMVS
jgi:hypothetical protein